MKKVNHKPSKRYIELKSQIDRDKKYPLDEALDLVKKTATTKFDGSVEIHTKLNIDVKKSDQQIRSSANLPHGNGKDVNVAVLTADSAKEKEAKEAGANFAGSDDLIEAIKKNKTDFDVLIATPEAMKTLAPVAKILGPKGLMPNPKDGTVTDNIKETVKALKKGKVNFKNDDSGNIHVCVGKTSFDNAVLLENIAAFFEALNRTKPSGIKSEFIKNVSLSSSMGPGIKVDVSSLS